MTQKTAVWGGMVLGSWIGGFIPTLFGVSAFSGWSIIGTAIGGIAGIYMGYKFAEKWLF